MSNSLLFEVLFSLSWSIAHCLYSEWPARMSGRSLDAHVVPSSRFSLVCDGTKSDWSSNGGRNRQKNV